MDVIGDVVHLDQVAFLFFGNALGIGVQRGVRSLRQQECAPLGAEDEVEENLG